MNNRGFTLVEMLVTLSLLSLVALTVFSTFAGGARVWKRIQCEGVQEQEVMLALDEMRRSFHNIHPFLPIPVEGKIEEFSFPTLLRNDLLEDSDLLEPARRGYYIDKKNNRICRSDQIYRLLSKTRMKKVCTSVLSNIKSLRFKYLAYHEDEEEYVWASSISSENPPMSVKVEMNYYDECSEELKKKAFDIFIPAGRVR